MINMKHIIFEDSGVLSVITPNYSFGELKGMDEEEYVLFIARKDVPDGKPYLIIEDTDIPENREDRLLWSADFSDPDGYGGFEDSDI